MRNPRPSFTGDVADLFRRFDREMKSVGKFYATSKDGHLSIQIQRIKPRGKFVSKAKEAGTR